ncbi:hypothetical protein B296_00050230, partial [Ensete ventricosum]
AQRNRETTSLRLEYPADQARGIRAKEIAAIRVYSCRAFTSPRISGFRPSIEVPKSCLTNLCQLSIDVVEIGWSEAV